MGCKVCTRGLHGLHPYGCKVCTRDCTVCTRDCTVCTRGLHGLHPYGRKVCTRRFPTNYVSVAITSVISAQFDRNKSAFQEPLNCVVYASLGNARFARNKRNPRPSFVIVVCHISEHQKHESLARIAGFRLVENVKEIIEAHREKRSVCVPCGRRSSSLPASHWGVIWKGFPSGSVAGVSAMIAWISSKRPGKYGV